jgi:hypothetical protein
MPRLPLMKKSIRKKKLDLHIDFLYQNNLLLLAAKIGIYDLKHADFPSILANEQKRLVHLNEVMYAVIIKAHSKDKKIKDNLILDQHLGPECLSYISTKHGNCSLELENAIFPQNERELAMEKVLTSTPIQRPVCHEDDQASFIFWLGSCFYL